MARKNLRQFPKNQRQEGVSVSACLHALLGGVNPDGLTEKALKNRTARCPIC